MGAAADFTLEGLGYDRRPGTVMGVSHYEGATEAAGLAAMFEGVWNDSAMVADVAERDSGRAGGRRSTARTRRSSCTSSRSTISSATSWRMPTTPSSRSFAWRSRSSWNKLYDFQRDAVVGAIHKLERYKGCIIADSVGLRKDLRGARRHEVLPGEERPHPRARAQAPARELDALRRRQRRAQPPCRRPPELHGFEPHRPLSLYRLLGRRESGDAPLGQLRPRRDRRVAQLPKQANRHHQEVPLRQAHGGHNKERRAHEGAHALRDAREQPTSSTCATR